MHQTRKLFVLAVLVLTASFAAAQGPSPHAQGVQDLMNDSLGQARISVDPRTGMARFIHLPAGSMGSSASASRGVKPQERAMNFFRSLFAPDAAS